LRFQNFKKLLDENPQILEVNLEARGEMFLNPELAAIIEYAYRKKAAIFCKSGVNLNNVNEDVLESLVKYRFLNLVCSIDGATPETYQIYRVGGDFKRVIEHIKVINHYKKVYKTGVPELVWQFVVFGHNEHELPAAKKLARELNMKFCPKMSWNSDYSPIRNKMFVMSETGWPAVTRKEYKKIRGRPFLQRACHYLWHAPKVNWDGRILGCCTNILVEFGGNAFEDGYIHSVNSRKINYAKKMLLGEVEPREDIRCSTCQAYLDMQKSNKYLRMNDLFPPQSIYYKAVRSLRHWARELK